MLKLSHKHNVMLGLLRPIFKYLVAGFTVMIFVVGLQLLVPSVIGNLIDEQSFDQTAGELTQTGLILLAIAVLYCGLNAVRFYLFEVAGNRVVVSLRRKLFSNLINLEIGFFDGQKVGELSSRLSADVESIRDLLTTQLAILVRTLGITIGGLIMLFYLSWQLAGLLLILVPLSFLVSKWMGYKVRNISRDLQSSLAESMDVAQESFTNVRQVQAFNRLQATKEKYASATENVLNTSVRQGALFAGYQGITNLITYSSLILILWSGGQFILDGMMTVGELTSFVMYAAITSFAVTGILGFWADWQSTSGSSEHIFALMERQREQKRSRKRLKTQAQITGNVRFEGVSFCYPQRPTEQALNKVSFEVKQGQKVAFVGASGAGKSTIASLILGFYEPDSGDILFDEQPYFHLKQETINNSIAMVEQEPNLFSGTIADNIAYGALEGSATQEQIQNAAQQANAHKFISEFKYGYQTDVGPNGVQLSGGQKQRLAIARAILRNPAILILDEASSALDADSEEQVQEALNHLMKGRTTLIIAHRLSTIVNSNQIVVLEKGQTVQMGNHIQLLQDENGVYKNLIAKQLQKDAA